MQSIYLGGKTMGAILFITPYYPPEGSSRVRNKLRQTLLRESNGLLINTMPTGRGKTMAAFLCVPRNDIAAQSTCSQGVNQENNIINYDPMNIWIDPTILTLAKRKIVRRSVPLPEIDEVAQNVRIKLWQALQRRESSILLAHRKVTTQSEFVSILRGQVRRNKNAVFISFAKKTNIIQMKLSSHLSLFEKDKLEDTLERCSQGLSLCQNQLIDLRPPLLPLDLFYSSMFLSTALIQSEAIWNRQNIIQEEIDKARQPFNLQVSFSPAEKEPNKSPEHTEINKTIARRQPLQSKDAIRESQVVKVYGQAKNTTPYLAVRRKNICQQVR